MTSAQFDADMFAMANNVNFDGDATYTTFMTETVGIDATTHKAELQNVAVANSIQINGLTQDTTAAAGKFAAADVAATEQVPAHTELTFDASEEGSVEVTYEVAVSTAKTIEVSNMQAAVGEVVCKWPVYPSSDDCSTAAVKGYVVLKMYRARVTQMPGLTEKSSPFVQ